MSGFHASAVVYGELGILIRGASGAGKSRLAANLVEIAAERGIYSALIGDDRLHLEILNERLIARGARAIHGLIETRGYGLRRLGAVGHARIDIAIDLLASRETVARMPAEGENHADILGHVLPRIAFAPTLAGRELAYRATVLISDLMTLPAKNANFA